MAEHADEKAQLLDAIREYGTITAACDALGLSRSTVRYWRDQDSDFESAVQGALADAGSVDDTDDAPQDQAAPDAGGMAADEAPVLDLQTAWDNLRAALRTNRRLREKVLLWAGDMQSSRKEGPLTDLIKAMSQ